MQTQYNGKCRTGVSTFCALVAAIAIIGCGSAHHGIVGTWHIDTAGPGGATITKTWEFKPDGNMVETMTGTTTYATYHYSVSGDTLMLQQTGANVDGKDMGVNPATTAARTIKFDIDDDKLTLTEGATDTVMTSG